jgi:hypothetical protein
MPAVQSLEIVLTAGFFFHFSPDRVILAATVPWLSEEAGAEGFEPPMAAPKAAALPLGDAPAFATD